MWKWKNWMDLKVNNFKLKVFGMEKMNSILNCKDLCNLFFYVEKKM